MKRFGGRLGSTTVGNSSENHGNHSASERQGEAARIHSVEEPICKAFLHRFRDREIGDRREEIDGAAEADYFQTARPPPSTVVRLSNHGRVFFTAISAGGQLVAERPAPYLSWFSREFVNGKDVARPSTRRRRPRKC